MVRSKIKNDFLTLKEKCKPQGIRKVVYLKKKGDVELSLYKGIIRTEEIEGAVKPARAFYLNSVVDILSF